MNPPSLRRRLTVSYAVVVSLLLTGFALLYYRVLSVDLNQALTNELVERASGLDALPVRRRDVHRRRPQRRPALRGHAADAVHLQERDVQARTGEGRDLRGTDRRQLPVSRQDRHDEAVRPQRGAPG